MVMRLIINADDFGMSTNINREIIRLMSEKKISSTTLIANAPSIEEALEFASSNLEKGGFGLHLNFTEYLAHSKKISLNLKYCDNDGILRSANSIPGSLSIFDYKSILEEWTSQYEAVLKRGVSISHIDSHHHFHTQPHNFLALKMFAAQTGIRWIRNFPNIHLIQRKSKRFISIGYLTKLIWSAALKYFPPFNKTANYFGSVKDFYNLSRISDCSFMKNSIVELMCHPGHLNADFRDDTSLLESRFWKNMNLDIQLTDYSKLK